MRILLTQLTLLMLTLVSVACAFSTSALINPTAVSTSGITSLPDLTITQMFLEMEGRRSSCVEKYTPYGIQVLVKNIGSASAGSFFVDLNGTRQQVDGGLASGQSIELDFPGTVPSGQYEAVADVADQVVEQSEENNSLSYIAPTPTPPPLCTATPTPLP